MRVCLLILGFVGITSFDICVSGAQSETNSSLGESQNIFDMNCCTRSATVRDTDGNITGHATVERCLDDSQIGCELAETIACNNAQAGADLAAGVQTVIKKSASLNAW